MRSAFRIVLVFLASGLGLSCKLKVASDSPTPREIGTGIDLEVVDGQPTPLTLAEGESYYIDRLALRVAVHDFPAPTAIEWLTRQSDFSNLDWVGMNGLGQEWEVENEVYGASRAYQDAAWMAEDHDFTLRVLDGTGAVLSGPLELSRDRFVMSKQAAFSWLGGARGIDDLGENAVTPTQLSVVASGTYSGPADDVYLLEVVTGGPMDGTASIDVTSVRGDDTAGIQVLAGQPFDISAAQYGIRVTATDIAVGTELAVGDRWVIHASTGDFAVAAPSTQASFGASANIILQNGSDDAELFSVPANAAGIELTWSSRPNSPFLIPVTIADPGNVGFGLDVGVTVDDRFEPGDTIDVTVKLFDDDGNLLHDENALPTFREFVEGRANGILYYDFRRPEEPCEVENDCRQDIMYVRVAGPKHRARQAYTEDSIPGFFNEGNTVPDFGIIYGGFGNPALWDTTISNSFEFQLPEDAKAGTYSVIVKAHRRFLGESSYVMKVVPIQVGTDEETLPSPDTAGACVLCHVEDAALDQLRHGTSQSYVCNHCHAPPHGSAAEIIHHIHFLSSSMPAARNDCSICHLTPVSNARASVAACGSCHGEIHEGEFELGQDHHAACGTNCHKDQPAGHIIIGPE